jgi:hypothetical protein
MNNRTKIVFTFDQASRDRLDAIMESGGFRTMGEAVSEALWAYRGLQTQAEEGFNEVIVRNPKTNQERVMRITRPLAVRVLDALKDAQAS